MIQDVLLIHLKIEETLFYPALQDMKVELVIRIVLKALKDHEQVKTLLEELKALSSDNTSLDPKMGELQRCLFSHLELEETEILPHVRS